MPNTLGEEVRNWREYRGLGLRELAKLIEINPGYLSRIETDQKIPRPKLIRRLAKRLHLPADYFDQHVARSLFDKWKLRTGGNDGQK